MHTRIWVVGLGVSMGALGGCSNGADGTSCSVSPADGGAAVIECTDGTSETIEPGMDGMDGADGEPGADGMDGLAGAPGESCSVSESDAGVTIVCEDGSEVLVPPGPAGPPGTSNGAFGVSGSGVNVAIESVEIPDDRHPVAKLRITDDNGVGLDVTNVLSDGEVGFRFTFVHVPDNPRFDGPGNYVNYIVRGNGQPGDEGGTGEWTLEDPKTGAYAYRFELQLPEDYDDTETHAMSALAERVVDELTLLDHDFYAFVPSDPSAEPELREVSEDETCNTCHTRLTVHGDHRSGYQVCLTCHTQDAVDPDSGLSIAFAQMLHKVHMGANLPSVDYDEDQDPPIQGEDYCIIGYGGQPNCYGEVHFPQPPSNCGSCHTGPDAEWLDTRPSIEACGSCHDRTYFGEGNAPAGWVGHTGGSKNPDQCATCHSASSPTPLCPPSPSTDTSLDGEPMPGGGVYPRSNANCDGYTVHYNQFTDPDATTFTVDMFEVDVPDLNGSPLTFSFRARTGNNTDGPTTPAALADMVDFGIMVAGPTEDYANTSRVDFQLEDGEVALTDQGGGMFTGTLRATDGGPDLTWTGVVAAIADADPSADSFTFALRAGVPVWGGDPDATERGTGDPIYPDAKENGYVAYTVNPTATVKFQPTAMDPAEPRRDVVDDARCNNCHEDLRYSHHSGAYRSVKQCNMCHAPVIDRPSQRPRRRLGVMVHDIHGHQYASDGNPHTGYPGDTRNCEQCHLSESDTTPITWDLALPAGVLPTRERDGDLTAPITSFCTGCHNAPDTLSHARSNTIGDYSAGLSSDVAEACTTCHGIGETFGIDAVHAIPGYE